MAFSDSRGKFWEVDLSTQAGAQSATRQAAFACFVFCGLGVLGIALAGGVIGFETPEGLGIAIVAALEIVVALIAGLRFRAGKGVVWGIVTAVLCSVELISKLMTLSITGIFITGAILAIIVQGVRGALALRANRFPDEDVGAFY